jgi:hypothetical protein
MQLLRRMALHSFLDYLNMPPLTLVEKSQSEVLEPDAVNGNFTDQEVVNAAALALSEEAVEHWNRSFHDTTLMTAVVTNTTRLRWRIAPTTNTTVYLC